METLASVRLAMTPFLEPSHHLAVVAAERGIRQAETAEVAAALAVLRRLPVVLVLQAKAVMVPMELGREMRRLAVAVAAPRQTALKPQAASLQMEALAFLHRSPERQQLEAGEAGAPSTNAATPEMLALVGVAVVAEHQTQETPEPLVDQVQEAAEVVVE